MPPSIPSPRDPAQEVLVAVDPLREMLMAMLIKKSMFEFDARTVVSRMLEADQRGIASHGVRCILKYLDWMDLGDIDPRGRVLVEHETPAIAVLDGSRTLGHVAATKAMELAIKKAGEVGTGTIVVHHSHHLGAAAVYVEQATQAGMIGFCTSNSGAISVAAPNSTQPTTANNPWAWGIPNGEEPIIVDFACGASSWGKVRALARYGLPLPPGVAVDEAGNTATDPADANTILSRGVGGFGLALTASVLAGALAGGRMPHAKPASPSAGSEHFLMALNIAEFTDVDRFAKKVAAAADAIREISTADGTARVPGDASASRRQQIGTETIPLHQSDTAAIKAKAESMGIAVPW